LVKNPLPIAWLVPPAQLVLPELKLQTISPASHVRLDTTVKMTHQRSNALRDTTAPRDLHGQLFALPALTT